MTTTDTYRARIVEALRREADRIEAEGLPDYYAVNLDGSIESYASGEYARKDAAESIAIAVEDAEGGPVDPDIEDVQWGVMVPIEVSEVIAHARDLRGETSDIVVEYGLVAVDAEVVRGIASQDCPECDSTVKVPPGGVCPVCAGDEAGEAEGGES